jgi:mono/diheme cytochrome c family protein
VTTSADSPPRPVRTWLRRRWRRLLLGALAVFVLIQLVPYGRDHAAPASTGEPKWDSPRTRQLFMDACGDCHSNLTKWPWYANVAPVSWLTQSDVDGGRRSLDVSTWDGGRHRDVEDLVRAITSGEMPPFYYTPMHPHARLSSAEKEQLVAGLRRTLGGSQGGG